MSKGASDANVGRQAVLLVAAAVISQVVTALIYLFGARSVDPDEFGIVVTSIAIGTAAAGFLDFGSNSFWVRELARGQVDMRALRPAISAKILVTVVLAAMWALASLVVPTISGLWTAGPIAFAIALSQTLQVLLRARAKVEIVAVSIAVDRLAAILLMGVAVLGGIAAADSMWWVLTVGPLLGGAMCWWATPPVDRYTPTSRLRNPWRGTHYYGLSSVSNSAQALDVTVLSAVGGATAAGVYAAVSRWSQPLSVLAGAFSSASAPHLARARSLKDGWVHARKGIWLIFLAVLAGLVLIITAPLLVTWLLGVEYVAAVPVVQILGVAAIVSVVNQPLASFLQSMRFDREVSVTRIIGVVTQLAAVAGLASFFGGLGAALALLISQVLMLIALTILMIHAARRGPRGLDHAAG